MAVKEPKLYAWASAFAVDISGKDVVDYADNAVELCCSNLQVVRFLI